MKQWSNSTKREDEVEWTEFLTIAKAGWGAEIVRSVMVERTAPLIRYFWDLNLALQRMPQLETLEDALAALEV